METIARTRITVETLVNTRVEKAWDLWTEPRHIVHWNFASIDWHTTYAENDLRVGGKFLSRMESKDGKEGFDFTGTYSSLEVYKFIEYYISDSRRVRITFDQKGLRTRITEFFEAETTNSPRVQKEGWQAILDNFRIYAESPYPDRILHFEIEISNEPSKVYNAMIDEDHYSDWTSAFNSSSRYEGSWKKGSKIRFVAHDDNGNESGMVSRIRENIRNRFISIEHMGIIKQGVEITCGPDVDDWQGALENYNLLSRAGRTLLMVDLDSQPEWEGFMKKSWPKALRRLKEICEE